MHTSLFASCDQLRDVLDSISGLVGRIRLPFFHIGFHVLQLVTGWFPELLTLIKLHSILISGRLWLSWGQQKSIRAKKGHRGLLQTADSEEIFIRHSCVDEPTANHDSVPTENEEVNAERYAFGDWLLELRADATIHDHEIGVLSSPCGSQWVVLWLVGFVGIKQNFRCTRFCTRSPDFDGLYKGWLGVFMATV